MTITVTHPTIAVCHATALRRILRNAARDNAAYGHVHITVAGMTVYAGAHQCLTSYRADDVTDVIVYAADCAVFIAAMRGLESERVRLEYSNGALTLRSLVGAELASILASNLEA